MTPPTNYWLRPPKPPTIQSAYYTRELAQSNAPAAAGAGFSSVDIAKRVSVWWNATMRQWAASYRWSGLQTIYSGNFATALEQAVSYCTRCGPGSDVLVELPGYPVLFSQEQAEYESICKQAGLVVYTSDAFDEWRASVPWQATNSAVLSELFVMDRNFGLPFTLWVEATGPDDWRRRVQDYLQERRNRK